MAERPIFIPVESGERLVSERSVTVKWNSGFAPIQKEKNVTNLHEAAAALGYSPILEVSTKSPVMHGRRLSAFSLRVSSSSDGEMPLENAFQGSKVFALGGPFTDLYHVEPREAKRDERLRTSGQLTGFFFDDSRWSIEPKTAFYDWLYVSFLTKWREWATKLSRYAAFTDIEFNPKRSLNCQARSIALFVALLKRGLIDEASNSPEEFVAVLRRFDYGPEPSTQPSIDFDR
jgi:hypothetical protein